MPLYGGIDLHANNSVVVLLDEQDQVVYQKRLPNDLPSILQQLSPYHASLHGVVVESTYNWYWLVDGLMERGYVVHLANTAAIQQYAGLKYTDDHSDARWLAHLLRLGVLPTGHIYPKEERAVRDLLRKRTQLVQHKTTHVLSIQNLFTRNTGGSISSNRIKQLTAEDIDVLLPEPDLALAVKSNLAVMRCLETHIAAMTQTVTQRVKLRVEFQDLLTVSGIGQILARTIMRETGDIRRFPAVGNFASYARCVDSVHTSNGKKKGEGNTKNGNKYLAWAFVEAANFARRYCAEAKRFYERKKTKTNNVVAIKALAHKLARACFHILKERKPFDVTRCFA